MTDHLVIQISDIHLTSVGELFPGARPRYNLVATLRSDRVRSPPDMFLLTGDLANTGEPACYADLADLMEEGPATRPARGSVPAR